MNPRSAARRSAAILLALLVALPLSAQSPAPSGTDSPAPPPPPSQPTNLARGFNGATTLIWDRLTNSFIPMPALSAVVDDDVASGWTPPTGQTRLLIVLTHQADLASLSLYAPGAAGTYAVSTAPSAEAVGRNELTPLAAQLDIATATTTNLVGNDVRYVMIELNLARTAPLRGVQIIGSPRADSAGVTAVVAPGSNDAASENKDRGELAEVNFALKAIGAESQHSDAMIDGDTATSAPLVPEPSGRASALIRLANSVEVDRVALAVGRAVGQVAIYANDGTDDARLISTIRLDGTIETISVETPGIRATFVRIEWTPADGSSSLDLQEVGVFAQARVARSEPLAGGAIVVEVMPVFGVSPPLPPPSVNVRRDADVVVVPPTTTPPPRPVSL